jgi:hypothetical protein
MIRRLTRGTALVLTVVAAAMAAACGDSATAPNSPIGIYTLASVNDDNVPSLMFEDDSYKLEIARGTLEVDADVSYVAAIVGLETVDVNVSVYVDSLRGTWTETDAGTMNFTVVDDNSTFTGAWQGNRITILLASGQSSRSMVFQR